ncbi:MAG: transcriptional regulator GcvA [Gammaproteobacteria bacterium]|nr:transcriptional regulator GcvA [Gammaproteobacteria bacterium]
MAEQQTNISERQDRKSIPNADSGRLPPLNALKAFEAAGRHLSFSRAADELHVTPAAIGHQVKALEDYLGVALFVRGNRRVELSETGALLLPGISGGFQRMLTAVESFRRLQADHPLVISIVPAFGGKWLLKRLDRFRELHPEICIRIEATERVADFSRDSVDIAIRYGSGDYPGLRVDCLLGEEVYPVCSPALLEGEHPLREPADLQHHVLINGDWNPNYPTWPDWEMWLKAAGLGDLPVTYGPRLSGSSESLLLEEAIAGRGVTLASSILVADDIEAGRLIRPFDVSFPVQFCYWLVCPEAAADLPRVRTFREWLLSEVGVADAHST